jgi:inhibitor of KinA sporulation pathway (predicted exonuclease)
MATLMANDGGGGKTSPASLNSPRYWLVMDFEATCEDGERRWPNEIIEWPCVLVDAETKATVDEFRSFVRPTERPSLTPFCTRLTSITQADVIDAPPLPEVLAAFDAWLRSYGASEDDGTALSVWCGDWDLATCLPRECARKGLDGAVPPVLRRWCNVKLPFVEVAAAGSSKKRQGMDGMLRTLSLPLEGHHHLGIDDARNIAKIAVELARRGGDRCIAPTSRSPPRPQIYRGKKGNGGGDGCSGGGGRPRGFGTKRAGGDGGVSGCIGCHRGGSRGSGGRDAAAARNVGY